MEAREVEQQLLRRCVRAARVPSTQAADAREANVFWLAGMVCGRPFAHERENLLACGAQYFRTHPGSRVQPGEMVRRGWVVSLPRLRDMLREQLFQEHSV